MSNPRNQDPGWEHGTPVLDKGTTHVRCKYCEKVTKGGIYRHKLHLVGGNKNVQACTKCPQVVRDAMREFMLNKKQRKKEVSSTATMSVPSNFDDEGDDGMDFPEVAGNPVMGSSLGSSTKSIKGPMDLYFNKKEHQSLKRAKGSEQVTLEACKELRERAMVQFSRWMYEAGLPFNCVQYTKSLQGFIECVAQHGPGMKPPSYHEVRVTYLKKEVEHVKELFKPHQETCDVYGCSLMMDKWTDRRGHAFINILVNCSLGSYFLQSVDVSKDTVDAKKMLELFETFVNQVGKDKVVQVISDNSSENVRAGKDLMKLYPTLYWTPCAAHCINLMFKDIFEIRHFSMAYKRALKLSVYIHSKTELLNWLRKYTGKRDLVKFAKTRFATAFLTFKRLHKQKNNLRKLFNSEEFLTSSYFKEVAGKECSRIVQMPSFWNTILEALKIGGPLISTLRLVDGDVKPSMGYIYPAMEITKKAIQKSFDNNTSKYKKVFEIIDKRWTSQLRQPLHAAAYYLNPDYFRYRGEPHVSPTINSPEVVAGFYSCLERLVPDQDLQDKITKEVSMWEVGDGLFGLTVAKKHRGSRTPVNWWTSFGGSTPHLKEFAIKLLSLTTSASGCERNWSVFEHLHSKKRSRLEHMGLNDLVFIKYNRALRRRWEMQDTIDPISLDQIDFANEWLTGIPEDANELVFGDGDDLTCGDIVKFSGANETPYSLRHGSKGKEKVGCSNSRSKGKGKEKVSQDRLVNEDEDDEDEEEACEDDGVMQFDNTDLFDEEEEFDME
ncbi:PREDICTED: uncharacterized protein LOC109167856 [Ipomoea nil]|uniref:uncharacterized protein LOC109167856 n=1 Tax=Ipomoea nil TaxID=35883 RepID=UPI0009010802|nr:PREDICTED: uncharacterized protein LOC109167856 [Ipomoea nil]